ncbi:2'-5' RNA ligase family protein [Streptomyces sp. SBT349]|uniref:2'-5' RNA ligase family protein n=1 Tax=Streptomyces sp. SBT349 TaxID=1580539 RepID=UPI00066AF0AB|nr:2'-5' RNA ligase family protein [Streptomyces sp. SBT349]
MSFADLPPGHHASALRDHWWWRPGWHVGQRAYTWHLTFEGQNGLHRLVSGYQRRLSTFVGLDPIPPTWLHLTMQGVGFTEEVDPAEVGRISKAVRRRLADLPTLALGFKWVTVADEALVLPPVEEEAVRAVRGAVRRGIGDVWGMDRIPENADRYRPHVSVAYSNRDQEAAPLVAAVARMEPEPALVTVPAASLIVIHRDHRVYEWEMVEQVPIGARQVSE